MLVVKTSVNKCREHCIKGEAKEKWSIRADKEFHNIQHTGKQTSGNGSKQIISNLLYTVPCKVMQSKFMSVKCLPDGELPEDEKRNLAVRELLLAATEDKYESIDYLLL